jgi:hypothetical protein
MMKISLLQNAMAQSLISTLLCGAITVGLLRQPSLFEQDGVAVLMPKVSSSVRDCPLPTPKLSVEGRLKLIVEDEHLVNWFFSAVKERAAVSGLRDLRTVVLPTGDFELRLWELASMALPSQAFVLKRTNGQWNALLLRRLENGETENPTLSYPKPKIGWEVFWGKLVTEGILTLPNGYCLRDYFAVKDGVAYVVEINLNGAYRIYSYYTPQSHQVVPEAKQMCRIVSMIFFYDCTVLDN